MRSRADKFECPPKMHAETENVKAFMTFLYVMESGTGSPILIDDRNAHLLAQILVSLIGCSGQDASKFSRQGFV